MKTELQRIKAWQRFRNANSHAFAYARVDAVAHKDNPARMYVTLFTYHKRIGTSILQFDINFN